jgi:hypothetical protein
MFEDGRQVIAVDLAGKKTWEIRRTQTNFRGRIAFGNTKTKKHEGYATIIDCKEFTVKDLKKFGDKHHANKFIDGYAGKRDIVCLGVIGCVH